MEKFYTYSFIRDFFRKEGTSIEGKKYREKHKEKVLKVKKE
ncbi:hypothetical protein [Clostridium sp. D53t1_180928_C8]|nr:hypothetical protein [Clostridium sp. D53t1_180928_C8]